MRVGVCIVGYQNPTEVYACVEAVAQSSYLPCSIVVVENGGPAAAEAISREVQQSSNLHHLPTRVIQSEFNGGFAAGVNQAIDASLGCDAWWILNPDTVPARTALEALVQRMAEGDVEAVGGVLHHEDGRLQGCGGRWRPALARVEAMTKGSRLDQIPSRQAVESRLDFILGASMLVSRRFVATVGRMREDYFLYGEEVEWFLRARARGLKLGFARDALVLHTQGTTTGSAERVARRSRMPIYLDERNKLNILRDTSPALLPIGAVSAFFLLLGRYGRRGAWRQFGYGVAGWWSGLRNRRGPYVAP